MRQLVQVQARSRSRKTRKDLLKIHALFAFGLSLVLVFVPSIPVLAGLINQGSTVPAEGFSKDLKDTQPGIQPGSQSDILPNAPEYQVSAAVKARVRRSAIEVFAPGAEIKTEPVDILFIHTHPDDESIDFGVLMARASASGKRFAVVLFTDGESGLDQYPRRQVGGIYPDTRLSGEKLAKVRVKEAEKALSVLGCSLYIRLGLSNSSYNRQSDVLTLKAKIRQWGGERSVENALYDLIIRLKPVLVVSPDSASKAREHFEHEAAGWAAKRAVDLVLAEHGNTVKAHITSVDPLQRGYYPDSISVNAMLKDEESGLSFRGIQALALSEHKTQRDASVIGVEVLSNFRSEYYQERFWNIDCDIESFLSN